MEAGIPETYGLSIVAKGDHQSHRFDFDADVEIVNDRSSQELTMTIDLPGAESLYWWLVEVIPQLRKDRQ